MAEDTASQQSNVAAATRDLFKDPTTALVQQRDVNRVQAIAESIEESVRTIMSQVQLAGATFEPSCLLPLLPLMMQTVETYTELPGQQKKAMVLAALKAALAAVVPLQFHPVVLPLIDPVVGAAIDFGVSAYHALSDEATKAGSKCGKWCFARCGKTKTTTSSTTTSTT